MKTHTYQMQRDVILKDKSATLQNLVALSYHVMPHVGCPPKN